MKLNGNKANNHENCIQKTILLEFPANSKNFHGILRFPRSFFKNWFPKSAHILQVEFLTVLIVSFFGPGSTRLAASRAPGYCHEVNLSRGLIEPAINRTKTGFWRFLHNFRKEKMTGSINSTFCFCAFLRKMHFLGKYFLEKCKTIRFLRKNGPDN